VFYFVKLVKFILLKHKIIIFLQAYEKREDWN